MSPVTETILEILKYTLPAIIVFITAYLLLRSFFKAELMKTQLKLRMNNQKEVLPLRLQAYERLALFLERISFHNLIPRVMEPNMSAKELQFQMIQAIRAEYEHNMSQQIYVSQKAWHTITLVKDEMIKTINLLGAQAPPNATAKEFSKVIFNYVLENEEELPTQKALDILKREVLQLF